MCWNRSLVSIRTRLVGGGGMLASSSTCLYSLIKSYVFASFILQMFYSKIMCIYLRKCTVVQQGQLSNWGLTALLTRLVMSQKPAFRIIKFKSFYKISIFYVGIMTEKLNKWPRDFMCKRNCVSSYDLIRNDNVCCAHSHMKEKQSVWLHGRWAR